MKKLFIIMISLMTLAGCSFGPAEDTAELLINVEPEKVQTFGLESIEMITDHYMVSVTNDTHRITYPTEKVTLDAPSLRMIVRSGDTTVKVDAYNKAGDVIGHGESKVQVKMNDTNSCAVTVRELSGKGNLNITVNSQAKGLRLRADIWSGASDHTTGAQKVSLRIGEKNTVSLDNGFYMVRLVDENGLLSIAPETVRIVKGQNIEFRISVSDNYDINIEIEDGIGKTPVISFDTVSPEWEQGGSYTVTASAGGMTAPQWTWFLDGTEIPGATGATVRVDVPSGMKEGKHTLTALASSGSVVWSENLDFTVVPGSIVPSPGNGIVLGRSEIRLSDADPATETFTVTRNNPETTYDIGGVPSWIVKEGPSSSGLTDTWTLRIGGNEGSLERRAVISVGESALTVIQPGRKTDPVPPAQDGIEKIVPGSLVFPTGEEGEQTFEVWKKTAATQYQVTEALDWVTLERTGVSERKDTWTVRVGMNPGSGDRKGTINAGGIEIPVMQSGTYSGPAAPESITVDSITPSWDGSNMWIGMKYTVYAHVEPLSAPQDYTIKVVSRGTQPNSQGNTDKKVPDSWIESFITVDPAGHTVYPYERGDMSFSPNYALIVSSADGTVSTEVPFTIGKDTGAGIKGISRSSISLSDHMRRGETVTVEKNTAESTEVTWSSSQSWLAAERTGVSSNGLAETWLIKIGPNRTSSPRTGSIVFHGSNGTKNTLTVSQPGDPSPERHTEWVYGVVPPEESEYVSDPQLSSEYYEIYERKDIDQGWYLATKSQLSSQDRWNQDDSMCWAFAASNMIHWWAEHDAEYIEAFRSVHPEKDIDITYDKDAEYIKDKSSVMPWFIERHGNSGGKPNVGLLDMLVRPRHTGAGEMGKDGVWADRPNKTYPGWFSEVFSGHADEIVDIRSVPTKKDFHDVIERALLEDKSIGLNIHYYSVAVEGGYHAINIWGVTYDENGEIVEIVVGDNNLNSPRVSEPNLAYLTNYKVTYDEGRTLTDKRESEVEFWNTGVKPGEERKPMGCINQLVFLDLGTELWEDWMAENGFRN